MKHIHIIKQLCAVIRMGEVYEVVCPESIQPHTMKNTFIEKDKRYKKHCT